ncbi:MAG: cupin domain-containing protein [Oleiphilaceae bacterium]|nr:cupin domain-containing protein [Oleiphilaceae bacterium]
MDCHSDFSRSALVHTETVPWQDSPMAGVHRRPLDRVGDEVARATSLVRYAPQSHFSPHVHHGGEEFLVLEGTFQDEEGDYPAGCYVRNPPGSRHTPGSESGCVIFVKLWQFDPEDQNRVRLNPDRIPPVAASDRPGVAEQPLYEGFGERVRIERWAAGTPVDLTLPGGGELLVLSGRCRHEGQWLGRHDWLRLPPGDRLRALAGEQGTRVWLKTGHLASVAQQLQRLQGQ